MEQNHSKIVTPTNADLMEEARGFIATQRLAQEKRRDEALSALREAVRAQRALKHELAMLTGSLSAYTGKRVASDALSVHVAMLALTDNTPLHDHLQTVIDATMED